jgi:hypothetical protein
MLEEALEQKFKRQEYAILSRFKPKTKTKT